MHSRNLDNAMVNRKPSCELNFFCVSTTAESRANIWPRKAPITKATVHSLVVSLLLFIFFFAVAPNVCRGVMLGLCFLVWIYVSIIVYQSSC